MSVGGTWIAQNKTLPGAYLNFISVPSSLMTVGDRGIGIIPLELPWGATGTAIEVESADLLTGASLATVGFTAFDSESKILNLMLQGCSKAIVFRTNTSGIAARATLGNLTAVAKHSGVLGNEIAISVVSYDDGGPFEINTFVRNRRVHTQNAADVDGVSDNDYVEFSGFGTLAEFAGEFLSGGTNGATSTPSSWMPDFLALANITRWQTMAVPLSDAAISKNVVTFIDDQRNNQGRYVQAVVCGYAADHEGIINSTMGAVIDGVTVAKEELVAWVAGITAGAAINESNTARILTGASEIVGELDRTNLERAVLAGKFTLSKRQDGTVIVTQDINSLTSFTQTKGKAFSKNRVIRTLDEIGVSTKEAWERYYMGKVDNDDTGRASYKGDLIAYYNSLQNLEGGAAITNFDSENDISVERGTDLDAVVVESLIQPVDSMEKLYKTVNVMA